MAELTSEAAVLRGPRLWLRAFVGFCPPRESTASQLDPVAKFLFSARSVILVISAQAAIVAGLLAATDGRFDVVSFVLVLIGFVTARKHIDQAEFDRSHGQRTLPVALGDLRARALNRAIVVTMYGMVAILIAMGRITPFAALVVIALPRAGRVLAVMARPKPPAPPPGYVGWPLWYHRVTLGHNRLFGWTYIAGLLMGAIVDGGHPG